MSHWRERFENKYVGAWTFEEGPKTGTIEKVTFEEISSPAGKKGMYVLRFKGAKLPMVCGIENCKSLQRISGKMNEQEWVGTTVELYATTCKDYGGKIVDCIRMRAPKKEAK